MVYKIISNIIKNMEPVEVLNVNYNVSFGYGTKADLLNYLEKRQEQVENEPAAEVGEVVFGKYPLIWLLTPLLVSGQKGYYNKDTNPTFIIATLNEDKEMDNQERISTSFELVLDKVKESFKWAMLSSGNTKFDRNEIDEYHHFNYAVFNDGKYNDVWDAIELTFDLQLQSKYECIIK